MKKVTFYCDLCKRKMPDDYINKEIEVNYKDIILRLSSSWKNDYGVLTCLKCTKDIILKGEVRMVKKI